MVIVMCNFNVNTLVIIQYNMLCYIQLVTQGTDNSENRVSGF